MPRVRPVVKCHGGKFYLAQWIISHFPKDYNQLTYVEPFIGGGSVLLNKALSVQEIINDKDRKIISIWKALRYQPDAFACELGQCPYLQEAFDWAKASLDQEESADYVKLAVWEYVVRRMSRGGMRKAFAWSKRLRGGKPGDLNAWNTALECLPALSDRVKRVEMWSLDFQEILDNWNHPECLLYLDPPYLKETRAKGATEVYFHEMSNVDHTRMLDACLASKAKIIVSGYTSALYSEKLDNWHCFHKDMVNHSSQAKTKKVKRECLWKNYK